MDELDAELVGACLGGDLGAWSRLIARYQRLIYSVARTICRRPQDVDDVFQQVCLDWFQQLGQLRHVEALPAWLITITRRRSYAAAQAGMTQTDVDTDIAAVDERIAAIEREHAVDLALSQASERCRRLIHLLYLDPTEPSYAEIARHMDMPESSIGPTRARCMEKLRKILETGG